MNESTESTTLAEGVINGAGDTITVELIRPADIPAATSTLKRPVVRITWPPADTVVSPQRFPDAAAFLTRLFAEAHIALAALKVSKKL